MDDDPLWLRCAREIWGEHWQVAMARYFGKSRQWANHMARDRQPPPPDILIYLRELLVRQRQQSLDMIAEIDATPGAHDAPLWERAQSNQSQAEAQAPPDAISGHSGEAPPWCLARLETFPPKWVHPPS